MLSRAALLLRDRNAAVAPMVAVLAGMLLAVAGVLLDTALYYASGRELRAATEAAALAAAMVPDQADARARRRFGQPAGRRCGGLRDGCGNQGRRRQRRGHDERSNHGPRW